MSTPFRRIWPESGLINPAIKFKIVDFPEPDAPRMDTNEPSSMSRLKLEKILFFSE